MKVEAVLLDGTVFQTEYDLADFANVTEYYDHLLNAEGRILSWRFI